MRSIISNCLLATLCLTAVSCVSNKPAQYYTITPPAGAINQSRPDGLVIVVADIPTPVSLQDGRIRYRIEPNQVGAYEYHRWTERPGTMVRNSLVRALRASGKYQRVLESSSAAAGDYLVTGKLLEFDEVDSGTIQTRVSLELHLIDRKTGRHVWDHLFEHVDPVGKKDVKDVVASLDRNLQQVVGDAAGQIDAFVSARR
jgi:cholesterol transport system auxiliary component